MKIYPFGAKDAPVLLLLPGTCCHWKSNFGAVIPLLADSFRVLCVSYDGFDETEQTEFSTMLEETQKIEAYLKTHCGGHIRAAYGCSLGGSFVGLLAARRNIRIDYGILGSSDLDQASPLAAILQTNLLLPLIYPVVRDGKFKAKFLQKRLDKRAKESEDYADVPPCRQQPYEGAAQRAAVGCPDVTTTVGLEVGFNLLSLLQHGGKFGLLGFIKAIVADTQHPETVCQKWNHRTKIAFPMATGARQQQQHRGILCTKWVNLHRDTLLLLLVSVCKKKHISSGRTTLWVR
jgi:pimeloyl-ACP methyl ester carboxylesterase